MLLSMKFSHLGKDGDTLPPRKDNQIFRNCLFSVYVYVCVYRYVYTHTYIYTQIYLYVHLYINKYIYFLIDSSST